MKNLSEKYPEFFKSRIARIIARTNNILDSYITVEHFAIREGWYALLDKYLNKMYEHCKQTGKFIEITDIKEKFGGMDINFSGGDDVIIQLMIDAGKESRHICEFCSYPHAKQTSMKSIGWIFTICDRCYNEKKYKRF